MGIMLVTVLITLHVLGDFYLQTERIAQRKKNSYHGVVVHAIQYGIPFMLGLIFIRFNLLLLLCLILSILAHFAVDSAKYLFGKNPVYSKHYTKPALIFLADQAIHITLLLLIALLYVKSNSADPYLTIYGIWQDLLAIIGLGPIFTVKWLLLILLILKPANIVFNLFFSTFKPEKENEIDLKQQHAGAIIGCLERILIVFFISINQFSALGFILTAKSIARYDAIAKDRKFAEYYLIGTLVSVVFTIAAYTLVFKGL